MWKICRGETRKLANWRAEFGKICRRKLWSLLPSHYSAGTDKDEANGRPASRAKAASLLTDQPLTGLSCWRVKTLMQTCREFNKPLWIAYVDLDCGQGVTLASPSSSWHPTLMVELLKKLYTVLADGVWSEWFEVISGVRQGCTFAPDLFLNPIDRILDLAIKQCSLGTTISEETFTDLDYADDIALLAEMLETGGRTAGAVLQEEAASQGLGLKRKSGSRAWTSQCSRWQWRSRLDEWFCVPRVTDILQWRKWSWDIAMQIEIKSNIWSSHIRIDTNVHLYKTYILPILLYECDLQSLNFGIHTAWKEGKR